MPSAAFQIPPLPGRVRKMLAGAPAGPRPATRADFADPAAWEIDLAGGWPRIRTPAAPDWRELVAERVGGSGELPLLRLCVRAGPTADPAEAIGSWPLAAMLHDGSWRQEDMIRRAAATARAAAGPEGRRRSAALRAACRLLLPAPAYPGQRWALEGSEIVDPDLDTPLVETDLRLDAVGEILVPPTDGGCFWGAAVAGWLQGSVADDRAASAHDRQRLRIEAAACP